ncbi:UNVERIFIED_CONTAM: hypothetical protein Sradi_0399000 [Sesamum radiatum]|uniref:Hexosyltransferase n=1 Tax=Sesamum radiatum TaxID=300843 RepID=A0AAW2W6L8_SESRA
MAASARLVTILTCLQFAFAIYATSLLYFMSPSLDLRTRIAQQWKQFIDTPHGVEESDLLAGAAVLNRSLVCESETIDFEQKKSDDALMIKLKTELYQEIKDFQSKNIGTETLTELMAMKSKWDLRGLNIPKVTVILNHLNTEADLVYILDDDMIPGKKMLQILSHVAGTEKYKNSVLGSIGRILPFRQKDFTFPSYRKFRSKEAGLYLPDPAYDITLDRVLISSLALGF